MVRTRGTRHCWWKQRKGLGRLTQPDTAQQDAPAGFICSTHRSASVVTAPAEKVSPCAVLFLRIDFAFHIASMLSKKTHIYI